MNQNRFGIASLYEILADVLVAVAGVVIATALLMLLALAVSMLL